MTTLKECPHDAFCAVTSHLWPPVLRNLGSGPLPIPVTHITLFKVLSLARKLQLYSDMLILLLRQSKLSDPRCIPASSSFLA